MFLTFHKLFNLKKDDIVLKSILYIGIHTNNTIWTRMIMHELEGCWPFDYVVLWVETFWHVPSYNAFQKNVRLWIWVRLCILLWMHLRSSCISNEEISWFDKKKISLPQSISSFAYLCGPPKERHFKNLMRRLKKFSIYCLLT